jgi:hypothetical protein
MPEPDSRQRDLDAREDVIAQRESAALARETRINLLEPREALVKGREDAVSQREAALEARQKASIFHNPTLLTILGGLIVAGVGLATNAFVTYSNNKNSQAIEKSQERLNLILQAIKTGNKEDNCKNLTFFIDAKLLTDENGAIATVCKDVPKGAPSLPVTWVAGESLLGEMRREIIGVVQDSTSHPVQGAEVSAPGVVTTTTDGAGKFKLAMPKFYYTPVKVTVRKDGYITRTVEVVPSPSETRIEISAQK